MTVEYDFMINRVMNLSLLIQVEFLYELQFPITPRYKFQPLLF